jgi:GTP cyclohydrolase I
MSRVPGGALVGAPRPGAGLADHPMDSDRVRVAVRELLIALGEDADRPDLIETPARTAAAWEELLGGRDEDPLVHLTADKSFLSATSRSDRCASTTCSPSTAAFI